MDARQAAAKDEVKTGVLFNRRNSHRLEIDADGNYLVTRERFVLYRGGSWSQAWMRYQSLDKQMPQTN